MFSKESWDQSEESVSGHVQLHDYILRIQQLNADIRGVECNTVLAGI